MSTLEIMNKVRGAEAEADEIRKAAAVQARDMIKAVEGAALQAERQAAQDIRAKVAAYNKEQDDKVSLEVEGILAKEREAIQARREAARLRVTGAADLIYERILAHGDH